MADMDLHGATVEAGTNATPWFSERALVLLMLCVDAFTIVAIAAYSCTTCQGVLELKPASAVASIATLLLVTVGIPYSMSLSWLADRPRPTGERYGRAFVVGTCCLVVTLISGFLVLSHGDLELSPLLPDVSPQLAAADSVQSACSFVLGQNCDGTPFVSERHRLSPEDTDHPFAWIHGEGSRELRARLASMADPPHRGTGLERRTLDVVCTNDLFEGTWSPSDVLSVTSYEFTAPARCSWFGTLHGPLRRQMYCMAHLNVGGGWDVRELLFDVSNGDTAPPKLITESRFSYSHDNERWGVYLLGTIVALSTYWHVAVAGVLMVVLTNPLNGLMSTASSRREAR